MRQNPWGGRVDIAGASVPQRRHDTRQDPAPRNVADQAIAGANRPARLSSDLAGPRYNPAIINGLATILLQHYFVR